MIHTLPCLSFIGEHRPAGQWAEEYQVGDGCPAEGIPRLTECQDGSGYRDCSLQVGVASFPYSDRLTGVSPSSSRHGIISFHAVVHRLIPVHVQPCFLHLGPSIPLLHNLFFPWVFIFFKKKYFILKCIPCFSPFRSHSGIQGFLFFMYKI